jgi:hypothetical protein
MQRSLDWPVTPARAVTQHGPRAVLARLRILRASLVAVLEPCVQRGSDTVQEGALAWPCGCEIALRVVSEEERGLHVELSSNDTDLEHVHHHLGIGELLSRSDAPSGDAPPRGTHLLMRQDDNGHRFEIRRFHSELAARCALATYEARGHKQLYTLERPPRST